MKRKQSLYKPAAIGMSLLMTAGLTACQGGSASSDTKTDKSSAKYQVTEENEAKEMVMNNQPESSYWFPEQLLEWNPEEDPDLAYNISTVPLAQRVDKENLTPVNSTQNKDTEVMAISIMNSSTSGNAPHGLNKVDCNFFTYWQYVDELVYWGGSSGEGLIVPPSPDVTDLGHKNGVPVIGTVFFPQDVAGGKMEWLNTFLKQESDGTFPLADKLIEVAQTYGFDGWFINQETEGAEEEPLSPEHAQKMQEFIKYMKSQAPELRVIYYDSMTSEGKMDWQNALTDKNSMFLVDEEGNAVADEMFLNFWWTEDKLASEELIKASAEKAEELGLDPYQVFAGVDIQADGYMTPIRWDLFESGDNSTHTSLGLYCPNWAYTSAQNLDDFHKKENNLWVNSKQDPSADIEYASDTQWHGVSTYAVEKSAITSLPFVTNFNTGSGYSFFKNGEQISTLDWNNRSIGDILPTYRWMMDHEGENKLTAYFDVGNAWYGGSSLKLLGNMGKEDSSVIHLYSADLPVEKSTTFTTTAKATTETSLNAVLTLDDGSTETLKGDKKVGTDWTTVTYDLSKLEGKNIRRISYEMTAKEEDSHYQFFFGNISMTGEEEKTATVSNVSVDDAEFDEDGVYAGFRLSWESDEKASYYEVYRINEDKSRSLLGVSNTECFYINTLPRTDETNQSTFTVVPVTNTLKAGKEASVKAEWPDNSLPKAGLKASQTLIGTGSSVTFESSSSQNTEEVSWTLPGSSQESADGESVTVTYDKAGVYDVTVTAKNKSGEDEKTYTGCILVTDDLAKDAELTLLSQGKATEATAYVNENEAPPFVVDGDVKKKWCATGTAPHELTIDLGAETTVSQVGISHAEAGGEGADMNTKAYTISVSTDGVEYTPVVNVTKNTAGTTLDTFAPVNARYVKLSVVKPTQGSDSAARIYEVQVYGSETPLAQ